MRSERTPWNTDKLPYNRRKRLDIEVDDRAREIKRRKDELEHTRLIEKMTQEVWDEY